MTLQEERAALQKRMDEIDAEIAGFAPGRYACWNGDGYGAYIVKRDTQAYDSKKWNNCVVVLSKHGVGYVHKDVRRIPAWEPKDGEAVFAKNRDGSTSVARCLEVDNDFVIIKLQNGAIGGWIHEHIKPFDPAKIGQPWDEV